ncbi:hypothetical protein ACI6Q2_09165 [Chitinophagaceae bacterium LWZ2-11]
MAFIGVLLRYKIAFRLPFIEQKYVLNAHSHFAFTGWTTHILMTLLVICLQKKGAINSFKKYNYILTANLAASYGMLISFSLQGYGAVSIAFSLLSILVSYVFGINYWRDLNKCSIFSISHLWFKAAIFFNILSSLGTFGLAYQMATKVNQVPYLMSIYFFLHFQYNGWFFFACMGLFLSLPAIKLQDAFKMKCLFWMFACACVPEYLLSVLWLHLPPAIYVIGVISIGVQVTAWILLVLLLKKNGILLKLIKLQGRVLLLISAIALSIKLLLQVGSVYLPLNNLVYGFRPIIIGYLHLVLLGVITIFILGYIVSSHFFCITRSLKNGIILFTAGIIINEAFLMIQGLSALDYVVLPYINQLLLIAALCMFAGLVLINTNLKKSHITALV